MTTTTRSASVRYVIRHADGTYYTRTHVGRLLAVQHRDTPEGVSCWHTTADAEQWLRRSGRFDGGRPSAEYQVVPAEVP